jgi:hypothetical protein
MVRTLTGFGLALVLVGSAHAQEQHITVKLDGKTHRAIRAEIYQAAQTVCADQTHLYDTVDMTCVEATYDQAIQQLRTAPRVERTAYMQSASNGPR